MLANGLGGVRLPVCRGRHKRACIWHVNEKRLHDRIKGQRDLLAIAGKAVIPPIEGKSFRATATLRCGKQRFDTTHQNDQEKGPSHPTLEPFSFFANNQSTESGVDHCPPFTYPLDGNSLDLDPR